MYLGKNCFKMFEASIAPTSHGVGVTGAGVTGLVNAMLISSVACRRQISPAIVTIRANPIIQGLRMRVINSRAKMPITRSNTPARPVVVPIAVIMSIMGLPFHVSIYCVGTMVA